MSHKNDLLLLEGPYPPKVVVKDSSEVHLTFITPDCPQLSPIKIWGQILNTQGIPQPYVLLYLYAYNDLCCAYEFIASTTSDSCGWYVFEVPHTPSTTHYTLIPYLHATSTYKESYTYAQPQGQFTSTSASSPPTLYVAQNKPFYSED